LGIRRERQIAFEPHHLRAAIHLDANRDHSGVDLFSEIGKTHGALRIFGGGGRRQRGNKRLGEATTHDRGDAEVGASVEKGERLRTSGILIMMRTTPFGLPAPAAPRRPAKWRRQHYRAVAAELIFSNKSRSPYCGATARRRWQRSPE